MMGQDTYTPLSQALWEYLEDQMLGDDVDAAHEELMDTIVRRLG